MIDTQPCISIGLPVFNGEKYIKQALDSILDQTYQNFELIISDNASTDNTRDICLKYAAEHKNIRYYRNKKNIGASENYNRVFLLSSGKYFKWAAHDDVLAPEYLSSCVSILNNDSSIVWCHSKTACIDKNGVVVGNYDDQTLNRITSCKPHERFGDLISPRNSCWAIMGVGRVSCLRKTPLHGDYLDADRNLLAELGLMGKIYEIPEHLFFRRDHPEAYTRTYYSKNLIARDYQNQLVWWRGNKKTTQIVLPHWKNCLEFCRSVNRVPLNCLERLLCYREISRWFIKCGWKLMKWDLVNQLKLWRIKLSIM